MPAAAEFSPLIVRGGRQRRLHKAFLRYHDPDNWPMLREALRRMGRPDLIGNGPRHLVPRPRAGESSRPQLGAATASGRGGSVKPAAQRPARRGRGKR